MKRFLRITIIAVLALSLVLFLRNKEAKSMESGVVERIFTQQDYEEMGAPDSVVISSEFTTIGKSAFFDCAEITSLILPDSLKVISDYAFASCTGLSLVEIPSGVTTIGVGAFRDCMRIETIAIPTSVTEFGTAVFERCDKLRAIYVSKSSPICQTLKDEYEDIVIVK